MIDSVIRKALPRYTQWLIASYSKLRLHPNHITLLSVTTGFAAAFLVAHKYFIFSIIVWWIGRLLDGTDGIFARASAQTSPFGAYLDLVCDMATYSGMILGFAFAFPGQSGLWLAVLFLYVLCITSALALGSQEEKLKLLTRPDNRGLRLGAGLAEGGETGIAYTLFLLFPNYIHSLVLIWISVLVITVVSRSVWARKELAIHNVTGTPT